MGTLTTSSGFESVQGRRWNMEDAHVMLDDLNAKYPDVFSEHNNVRRAFYAVFDGHGGKKCSLFLEKILLPHLLNKPHFKDGSNVDEAIRETCLEVDATIREKSTQENWTTCGSTGVFAVIIDTTLWMVNVGDSEAVIGRKKSPTDPKAPTFQLLTELHRPMKAEKKRLLAAGASLTPSKKVLNLFGGDLAVSRAFGDCDYKAPLNNAEQDWVIADPYIIKVDLTPLDDFILVACDGLWDHLGKQEAADTIARLRKAGKDPTESADALVKLSLDRGSTDNITAIVAYFHWN